MKTTNKDTILTQLPELVAMWILFVWCKTMNFTNRRLLTGTPDIPMSPLGPELPSSPGDPRPPCGIENNMCYNNRTITTQKPRNILFVSLGLNVAYRIWAPVLVNLYTRRCVYGVDVKLILNHHQLGVKF